MGRDSRNSAPKRDESPRLADPAAERAVLATIASHPEGWQIAGAALGSVWPEAFTQADTIPAAAAMVELAAAGRTPDWVNLEQLLAAQGADAGGIAAALRPHAESILLLEDRCAALQDAVLVRGLSEIGEMIRAPGRRTVREIAEEAHRHLNEVRSAGIRIRSAAEIAAATWESYQAARSRRSPLLGIPSPWDALNAVLRGFQPRRFYILGARPSHGKTAVACNTALAAAAAGWPVLIFSHEMSAEDLFLRMVCSDAALHFGNVQAGNLHLETARRFAGSHAALARLPLTINDDSGLSPSQCQALAEAHAARVGTKDRPLLVIVDYLQLERIPGYLGTRTDEIGRITAGWLAAAKRGRFALLGLAQLNRTADGSEPRLAHLRDSGAMEQDADAVILLHRPGKDNPDLPANKATLNVAKNRHGSLGRVTLHFCGYAMRFTEWREGCAELTDAAMTAAEAEITRAQTDPAFGTEEEEGPL